MKKIVNSLFVLVFGLGLVSGGMVNVEATSDATPPENNPKTKASVTFNAGGLEFKPVTKEINFVTIDLDGESEKYTAVNDVDSPFAVELTDARGLGKTWTLSAKLGEFTDADADADDEVKETLRGAKISFNDGKVESALGHGHEDINAVKKNIVLTNNSADSTVEVYSANKESNTGKWTFTWQPSDIKLEVPATVAQAGTHTATITWSLTDGPY